MKEQRQLTGIRYWYGDDFIAIQNELIEAQESFYGPYGNCILKGCEVVGQEIAPGICVISGKIARFAGATGIVSFPVYLQLQEVVSKTRLYQSGGIKEIERDFSAVLSTNLPVGDYITINSIGGRTFRDAFQDTNNRMVSDAQINTWNAKEPAIGTKMSGFNLAKSDAINSTATTTLATSAAAKLAYDRGSQGITDAAAALAAANTKEPAITKNTGFNLDKSDAINSTATTTLATSAAAKLAYDRGSQGITDAAAALSVANTKEPAITKNTGFNLAKSDAINSTATTTLATSAAVKQAYDAAISGKYSASVLLDTNYVTLCHVGADLLAGAIDLYITGTGGNTVVNVLARVIVNHSQDIIVRSESGDYSAVVLRIISDGNEVFFVQAKLIAGSASCRVTVHQYSYFDVQMLPPYISGDFTHEHTCETGKFCISSGAGVASGTGIVVNGRTVMTAPVNPVVSLGISTLISASHENVIVECTNSITITLPNSMPVGMRVDFVNVGTGTIIFAASTSIVSKNNAKRLLGQYAGASAYHRGSNVWVLVGDLIV
jgi:hypothetical protein